MEVKTFTSFWNMEKKLYAIEDVALPMPIPLTVAMVFLGVGIPWFVLMHLLHVPFANAFGILLWLGPPSGLAFISNRPIFQKKTFFQFLSSMFSYVQQPKRLAGLRRPNYVVDSHTKIKLQVFTREDTNNS